MYRIKQISTNRYLTHPEIVKAYFTWQNNIPSISTSKSGKVWKIRHAAIEAFKITIKTATKCGLDPADFLLEKYEMIVTESINHNNI